MRMYFMSTNCELSECWRSVHKIILSCKPVVLINAPLLGLNSQMLDCPKSPNTRLRWRRGCDVIERHLPSRAAKGYTKG